MNIEIRRAEPDDLDQALKLWVLLHKTHEALDSRYKLASDATLRWSNDFRELIRSDHYRYLVAEVDAAHIVGLLVAQLAYPTPLYIPEPYVHIDELVVKHDYRGQGIGQRLVNEAIRWADRIEATDVRAGLLAANLESRTFWRRLGAEAYSVQVIIERD